MDYRDAFRISAAGMAGEKLRVDVTALNLANMNSSAKTAAGLFKPLSVVAQSRGVSFEGLMQATQLVPAGALAIPEARVEAQDVAPRYVHDPAHPHADERGMVAYPGVNHAREMVNLVAALRSYEANVVAVNTTRSLAQRALDIGGRQ